MRAITTQQTQTILPGLSFALVLLAACQGQPVQPDAAALVARTPQVSEQADTPTTFPGTLRGARVALSAEQLEKLRESGQSLLYLAGEWDPVDIAEAARLAPNVKIVAGLDRRSAREYAARAHAVEAQLLSAEFLAEAKDLAWVVALSAGVERLLELPGLAERASGPAAEAGPTDAEGNPAQAASQGTAAAEQAGGLVLTNAKGVYGPVIAEHVFALLLAHARGLTAYQQAQARGEWLRDGPELKSLAGETLLVVGMGGIGEEVAQRAKAFGMRVLATVRTPRPAPPYVDKLVTAEGLDALLPEAHFVVLCVPLTPETKGLFDARRLALLPRGAFLVNIARGAVIDTDALVSALESGHLAGAGLDVTDPEPLPPGHRLWSQPGLILTPHVAADAELSGNRRFDLQLENLRRFAAGEPLLNVVDPRAGY
jgi:phosphoglycerate dehydrogenase-like enzyme